nr:LOW QUALITY PROTEIN: elongation of very long chain fatty acids protein AAEL008004-like [Rhipicephalus microplus]
MAFLWDKAVGMYYQYVVEATDSRVKSWPLMGSPMTMLTIIAGYIYFVKVWGPSWMKGREPFQIKGVLIAYNLIMVVLSTLFFVVGGSYTYLGPYNWLCQPVSYGRDPDSMAVTTLGWWYLLLKMVEFLDTVFFVLTKKFSHISLLHVVHHSTVAWTVWMGVNYGAGGQNAFFPFINCFVHIVMYTYYALAAMGPEVRKYLWWKRYLTQFQMVQFVIGFVHAAIPVFYDCGFPPYFAYILMGEAVLLFYMFRNFYAKAYKASQTARNVQQRNGHVKTAVTTGTDGTQAKLGLIVRSMSNHGLVPHRGGSMTTPVTS